ncbi:MAG: GTPase, partial [Myxococcota bacterium]
RQRNLLRFWMRRQGLPVLSIVGYTNAGKSTLLNRLTHSHVAAENKLFATLDPSSRRLRFPRERDVIVTDTVGFIRDLPPELIAGFRATLEEIHEADLLLHVVDATSPHPEEQIQSVQATLRALGLDRKPEVLILNKCDRLPPAERDGLARGLAATPISALEGSGIEALLEVVEPLVFPEARTPAPRVAARGR